MQSTSATPSTDGPKETEQKNPGKDQETVGKALEASKNVFVRMKREIGEHKPPSMTKSQRVGEFFKFLLGGVLPVLVVIAGIICACIFAGPAIAGAISSAGGVGALITAIGGVGALATVGATFMSPLGTWIIWNAKKVKNAFNIQGTESSTQASGLQGSSTLKPLEPEKALEKCQKFRNALVDLREDEDAIPEQRKEKYKRKNAKILTPPSSKDIPVIDTTKLVFQREKYKKAIEILTQHAKTFHIKIKTSEKFDELLSSATYFSDLEDSIQFTTHINTPSVIKDLIRHLKPTEAVTRAPSTNKTYKNMLRFNPTLDEETDEEKPDSTEEEELRRSPEEIERDENAIRLAEQHALVFYDSPILPGSKPKVMSVKGIEALRVDLNKAFGFSIKFEAHDPDPTHANPYFTLGGVDLESQEIPHPLGKSPISGWLITKQVIQTILEKNYDAIDKKALKKSQSPNIQLYRELYASVE